jgi:hypothetical protein
VIFSYISTRNSYVGDRHRCLDEGEQVLKAGHITHCYIHSSSDNDGTVVAANVVKSSSPKDKPHELVITIKDGIPAEVFCSCKAGTSGFCKHGVAVLLRINGGPIDSSAPSCTTKKCAWGRTKTGAELYDPVCLDELDCVRSVKKPNFSFVPQPLPMLHRLTQTLPYQCVLSRHLQYCEPASSKQLSSNNDDRCLINRFCEGSGLLLSVDVQMQCVMEMTGQEKSFYEINVSVNVNAALAIASAVQKSHEWHMARKLRVTGTFVHKVLRSKDLIKTF